MKSNRLFIAALLILLPIFGCSGKPTPEGARQDYPPWPELQALQSGEVLMPIDHSMLHGDMAGFAKALQAPAFATAVDTFEKAKIPAGYDDQARKEAREKVITGFRQCIELAKAGGKEEELKQAYDAARKAMQDVGRSR